MLSARGTMLLAIFHAEHIIMYLYIIMFNYWFWHYMTRSANVPYGTGELLSMDEKNDVIEFGDLSELQRRRSYEPFGTAFDWKRIRTGDPLHSRALAHRHAPLFTQPCPHCSHSRAPGEQWARMCVFSLQGCVQAARLCRGSPVISELRRRNALCPPHMRTS